ncbi:MAG: Hsp20/alpha crystallin family protein [Thermodesulfobacteriota bacterium]
MAEQREKTAASAEKRIEEGRSESPDVDIYVNDEEILLVADLPGVHRDNLTISLENDTLTIEAKSGIEFVGSPQRREFDQVEYRRVFTLPKGIDREKCTADLQLGVLTMRLPRAGAGKPCQIAVTGE